MRKWLAGVLCGAVGRLPAAAVVLAVHPISGTAQVDIARSGHGLGLELLDPPGAVRGRWYVGDDDTDGARAMRDAQQVDRAARPRRPRQCPGRATGRFLRPAYDGRARPGQAFVPIPLAPPAPGSCPRPCRRPCRAMMIQSNNVPVTTTPGIPPALHSPGDFGADCDVDAHPHTEPPRNQWHRHREPGTSSVSVQSTIASLAGGTILTVVARDIAAIPVVNATVSVSSSRPGIWPPRSRR